MKDNTTSKSVVKRIALQKQGKGEKDKPEQRVPRVFCPSCGTEMDPCLMTCSECGAYLQ